MTKTTVWFWSDTRSWQGKGIFDQACGPARGSVNMSPKMSCFVILLVDGSRAGSKHILYDNFSIYHNHCLAGALPAEKSKCIIYNKISFSEIDVCSMTRTTRTILVISGIRKKNILWLVCIPVFFYNMTFLGGKTALINQPKYVLAKSVLLEFHT